MYIGGDFVVIRNAGFWFKILIFKFHNFLELMIVS